MTEESLFQDALAQAPEKRALFLDQACAGRPELRAAVAALLAAHDKPGNLLDRVPGELAHTMDSQPGGDCGSAAVEVLLEAAAPPPAATTDYRRDAHAGAVIAGRYTLQEKIGEGGMGEVWVARQTEPVKRKVALKLIKTGMDSRAVLQRFEQERQALAMMDHPNIARVLDAGMTPTGQPFFVMELVNGLPLNQFCDDAKLAPKERLELFIPICQAVQHAHHKGIVHRDLKPANILVTMIDGRPVPKVIDFGVAKATAGKLTEETMSTGFGAVVGTLEYMSPEQAAFSNVDIDTRADIYSLGVILYELLTGLRPIDAHRLKQAALTEMIRMIREEEPSRPSTRLSTDASLPSLAAVRQIEPRKLMALLRGDLDWVVMKCLEKQRERRYETASGLARDIQRYLDGDAVEACPPSMGYRLSKFLKRNKGPVIAASLLLAALVSGFIGTAWGMVNANRARRAESVQRQVAETQKQKAVQSEALARQQRVRAEEREQQAIDAVKRFRDAVVENQELKNSPSLAALRKTLLKEPLAFFLALRDRLQADRDTRPESLDRLADASYDLGYLIVEIGDKEDALSAIRESIAIWQKLAEAHPDVTKYQSALAISHNTVGVLLGATGTPAEAMEAYKSALAIQQMLADAHPTDTDYQRELAGTHNNLGDLLMNNEKPAEAMKAYESSLAIRQKLADDNPAATDILSDLAASHHNIGMQLHITGRRAEAMKAYESALAIQQELAEAHPTVIQYQVFLANHHQNIGELLNYTGKPSEAMKHLESSLAINRRLAEANPASNDFQLHLAGTHCSMGDLLRRTGKPAEALKAFESSLAIAQKLVDENPAVTPYRKSLADTHESIGDLLLNDGRPAEALKAIESAQAIWEKLADANPTVPYFQRQIAANYSRIGHVLMNTGKPFEALKSLESARALLQELADANPAVTHYQRSLANCDNTIGTLFHQIGNRAGSQKAWESTLATWEKLARENADSPDYASDLGGILHNLANIDLDARRFEEARARLLQAVQWQRKALAANPANPKYRQFMANHQINLIRACAGLGDSEGVADAERQLAEFRVSEPIRPDLDARLVAIIAEEEQPRDEADRLALAQRAYEKSLHATAARLLAPAIEANRELGDDRQNNVRYNAACAAALAACGKGLDDPAPGDGAKSLFRQQAFGWLTAELQSWTQSLATADETQRAYIARILQHWKQDPDLAGIRDADELELLPEAERESWKALWVEVDELLAEAAGQPDEEPSSPARVPPAA